MRLDPMTIQIDRRPDATRGQKPQLSPGGTPAVQQWQMNYNKRHGDPSGLTPLKPDGLWGGKGSQTQRAFEQEKATQQTLVQDPALVPIPPAPMAPPAPPPDLTKYESIYPRLAEQFNTQIGPLRNYPGIQQVLRQKSQEWSRSPGMTPRLINWLITKTVDNFKKEDLSAFEQGGPGVSQVQTTKKYR